MIRAVKRGGLADEVLRWAGEPRRLAVLIGALFAILAWRAATMPVDDPDVWWIAAAGRDMLATGHAPVTNAYSYTAPDEPWIMHELAFGLLYARGLSALGPSFFPLLTLLAAAVAVTVAAAAIQSRTKHRPSAGIALLVLLLGCREALFAPRPSHTALMFPLAMTALAFRPGWSLFRTLGAILLEVVWTNAHGSFPLGVAILGASSFADRATLGWRLAATAAAGLATLANPYGLRLHGLVEGYALGSDPTSRIIHEHIVEFFPIWRGTAPFLNAGNAAALFTVAMLALVALVGRRNLARAALTLALVALAAYQVRHVTLAVVLGAVLMHAEIDDLFAKWGIATGLLPRWLVAAFIVPGLVVGLGSWSILRSARASDDWIAAATGGPPLARLVRALPDRAQVYVPWESAGLAIWLGAERGIQVFFDSRNDCYPAEVAEQAFALERGLGAERIDVIFWGYRTDSALVPVTHPVYEAVQTLPAWSHWRTEEDWTGFQRGWPSERH